MSPFEPTVESLSRHELPGWFADAKLGIMVSWGLFSVPAWAPLDTRLLEILEKIFTGGDEVDIARLIAENPTVVASTPYAEWYQNSIAVEGSPAAVHHAEVWGDRPYDSFREEFARGVEAWDPDGWVDLFARAGARYVVPLTKHHDGFLLWPSRTPNPYRGGWQVTRDVIGELGDASRARGLEYGLYYSGGLDWTFGGIPMRSMPDVMAGVPQTPEYAAYVSAHWTELIERYEPKLLWNDIGYPSAGDPLRLFGEFYEQVPDGVVNDRFGAPHWDFRTPEYATLDGALPDKWETVRGLGYSFGYNRQETDEHLLSVEALVRLLVDIVAKNGNLLLGVGADADGTIPEIQRSRLDGLGAWLEANGEAIYGTRPWTTPVAQTDTGLPVRYTAKGDAVYAILLEAPDGGDVLLPGVTPAEEASVRHLPSGGRPWRASSEGIRVDVRDVPASAAHAFEVRPVRGERT